MNVIALLQSRGVAQRGVVGDQPGLLAEAGDVHGPLAFGPSEHRQFDPPVAEE